MYNVLVYGDSVTWGIIPDTRNRFAFEERWPGVLVGSPSEIAERLQRYREQYGISYISVLEPHMAVFADVIKQLR